MQYVKNNKTPQSNCFIYEISIFISTFSFMDLIRNYFLQQSTILKFHIYYKNLKK